MILSFSNKNMFYKWCLLLAMICAISACSSASGKRKPAPVYTGKGKPASLQSKNQVIQITPYREYEQPVQVIPYQEQPISPPVQKQSSAAVLALLTDADKNYNAGNFQSAVGAIERALRIEPRNASLVYKLAAIKLKQSKPEIAENLAKKSALLAGDDAVIKKRSWLLIAEARRLQGDNYGASEAKKYAERF